MSDEAENSRSIVPSINPGISKPPHPLDGEWFVHISSETYGPYTGHKIKEYVADGRILPTTDVMRKGADEWTDAVNDRILSSLFRGNIPAPAARIPAPAIASGPVSAAPGATVVQVTNTISPDRAHSVLIEDGPARPKSAGTALVLSILIVGLGQLYNGQVGKGILMFFLCIALWFVLLGWIINIWSWVDAYQTASRMNERYYRRISAGLVV